MESMESIGRCGVLRGPRSESASNWRILLEKRNALSRSDKIGFRMMAMFCQFRTATPARCYREKS